MKRFLIVAAVFCVIGFGQERTPTFEVASLKRNVSGGRSTANTKGGTLTVNNVPIRAIIAMAYQVQNDRVTGPAWLDTESFDIIAKPGTDVTPENFWLMLQNLLAERFKLAVHREQNPVPVYALVVAKNGPKLQPAAPDAQRRDTCGLEGGQFVCENHKSTMADLARNMPRWLPRGWFELPLVDQTGLTGAYDFTLKFTPTNRAPGLDEHSEITDPAELGLFEALQNQLGLKIERRKAPLERIVVDHIERNPVEN